jgi:hypothetical protein
MFHNFNIESETRLVLHFANNFSDMHAADGVVLVGWLFFSYGVGPTYNSTTRILYIMHACNHSNLKHKQLGLLMME